MGDAGPIIALHWGNIVAIVTSLSTVAGFTAWLHPKMRKLMDLLDDWNGEKGRPGVPERDGVMTRLAKIEGELNLNQSRNDAIDEQTRMLKDILQAMRIHE